MEKKNDTIPEIVIPKGYAIDEILDMDDSCFGDEQPILQEAQSYYEYTAIKAIKDTPCYTPPKASNGSNNKPSGNGSGKEGK